QANRRPGNRPGYAGGSVRRKRYAGGGTDLVDSALLGHQGCATAQRRLAGMAERQRRHLDGPDGNTQEPSQATAAKRSADDHGRVAASARQQQVADYRRSFESRVLRRTEIGKTQRRHPRRTAPGVEGAY